MPLTGWGIKSAGKKMTGKRENRESEGNSENRGSRESEGNSENREIRDLLFSNRDLRDMIVPLFFEQLLILLVGIADTFMVSYAGDAAVSGVSLVNMLVTFFLYVFTALASGGAVIISHYIGGGSKESGNRASGQLLMILAVTSVILMVLTLVFKTPVLKLLYGSVDTDVMAACETYLRINAYSFPAIAIYNASAALCRSMGKTKVTFYNSVASNAINIVGNAIGIFVLHAGVAGVAWPTFIARYFSAVAVTAYCLNSQNTVYYTREHVFDWDLGMIRRILHIAIPNSVENGLFQLIKIFLGTLTARFGTAQIAANGVAQTIWSLAAIMVIVMGPVYITVIGQCLGKGDVEMADYYFKKLTVITEVAAISWNLLILALTPLLMRVYPLSAEIKHLIVVLVVIHNLFSGVVWPVGGGLPNGLRAAGDIKFTMIVAVASTVVVRLALSFAFAVGLGMGVIGIAWAMAADWTVRCVIFWFRYRGGKWKTFRVV